MAIDFWSDTTSTGGTIQLSNQFYIWGNDTASSATTAGGFTDTATTAGGFTDTATTATIRPAQFGEFTFRYEYEPIAQVQAGRAPTPGIIQGPDEAPVTQRLNTPAKPTPQAIAIANARGQNLLKEIIGEVLYHRFQKQGWIDVKSIEKPEIMYRIRPWQEIALFEKNAKKEWVSNKQSICIHARERHVEGDEVAAHVLLCRYNEKVLWKMGNLHGVRRAA